MATLFDNPMIFGSDMAGPRNALEVRVVRAPFPRASVVACDPASARAVPGVLSVTTAADLPESRLSGGVWGGLPVLARGEVLHAGQAVALVAATNSEAAELAVAALDIRYQPLPPVNDLVEAVALHAFHGEASRRGMNDLSEAMDAAPRKLTHSFEMGGQERGYPEAGWALAEPDGTGGLHVVSSCALPFELQATLSTLLGLPMSALRVSVPARTAAPGNDPLPAIHAALVALAGGRPARVRTSPEEQILLAPRRPGVRAAVHAGHDERGRILALDVALFVDAGCAPVGGEAFLAGVLNHLEGTYSVPATRFSVRLCRSHNPVRSADLGDLAARSQLAIEDTIARVARNLGLLPEVVRQRNIAPSREMGTSSAVVDPTSPDGSAVLSFWKQSLGRSDFLARRKAIDAWNARSPLVKRGLAALPTKLAPGIRGEGESSSAHVRIHPDGSVRVASDANTAALRAKVLESVVAGIGARPATIRVVPVEGGSGDPDLAVGAVAAAVNRLRAELLPLIMRIFHENGATGVLAENLRFSPGRIADRLDPNLGFPFESLIAFALAQGCELSASGTVRPPRRDPSDQTPLVGVGVAEVEVDSFTGICRILRADLFHESRSADGGDSGKGERLRAAFMEGVGWLTSEQASSVSDGASFTGNASRGPMVPGLDEEPPDFRVEFVDAQDRAGDASEGGHALALSVREALRDAISAFGVPGTPLPELPVPAMPEAIYRLVQAQRAASTAIR